VNHSLFLASHFAWRVSLPAGGRSPPPVALSNLLIRKLSSRFRPALHLGGVLKSTLVGLISRLYDVDSSANFAIDGLTIARVPEPSSIASLSALAACGLRHAVSCRAWRS